MALICGPRYSWPKLKDVKFVSRDQISQSKKHQQTISRAFEGACEELRIGMLSLDAWKREQLALLILSLVAQGELDGAALQRRAVSEYKNANSESSSTA
jgi:hypothetical protein